MQKEANQYLIGYLREDGEKPEILKDPLFSFVLKRQNMFMELSSRLMGAGWEDKI
jgi:hypothetical protein